jgi:cutinase
MRPVRISLVIGSCWLALLAVVAPANAVAARAPRSCPDVTFVGARGSGEPADRATHGMGASVSYMADRLDQALGASGLTMSTLSVIYPALGVDVLKPTRAEIALMLTGHPLEAGALYYEHNLKRYVASINEGISQTVREATIVAANCRNTSLVMAGYSQGAMVIHQAELQLDDQRHVDVHDAIIGSLLLGDGDRVHDSRARLVGSAPRTGEGVRVYVHRIRARDVDEPWSTAEICNSQDIVCDFNLDYIRSTKRAAHASAVHTGYLAHDPTVLDQAVDWLASEVRRSIGPWGLVGPLRLDASTASDVTALMGAPALTGDGSFVPGGQYADFHALGYGCAPGIDGPDPLLWHCQIIFYINAQTNQLAAVATKSSRFIGPAGIYVAESARQAERRLHVQAFSGCGQGFNLGSRRNRAQMLVDVRGGSSHNGVLTGGRIEQMDVESRRNPVGLLFC